MWRSGKSLLILGLFAGATAATGGCSKDEPSAYGRQRPPVGSLDPENRRLQGKDVVEASDRMARSILADERLRQHPDKWAIVVMPVENHTVDRRFTDNYDVFIERLGVKLSELGKGSVELIENRGRFDAVRNRELDFPREGPGAGAGRVQPSYALYAKVMDLPNRNSNYYMVEFTITDLNSRVRVWNGLYEVQAVR